MFKLLKYLKEYKKESIIGPLFKLLEASFELIVPLVMASIIDIGIKNRDIAHILKMGAVMVFFGVLGLACSLTAQYFAAKAAVGFGTNLRKQLFAHISRLPFHEVDQLGTSTLITRMTNDINQVQAGVNLVLRLFLRSPFIVVGAMIMAFLVNAKISVIFVLAIPVLSVVIYLITAITIPMVKKVQSKLDAVLQAVRENLEGARVIRAFNRQKQEISSFQQSSDTLMRFQLLTGKISALLNPVTYVIVNAAIIAIIWFGGLEVDQGIITQGEVVALINYMSQILLALVALANLIIAFTKAVASGGRIQEVFVRTAGASENSSNASESAFDVPLSRAEVFESEPGGSRSSSSDSALDLYVPESTNILAGTSNNAENAHSTSVSAPSHIDFKNVFFSYPGAKESSLSNITFSVDKGETIGIIGGTGAGKTTLINLILRLYDATKGKVLVDGQDIQHYSPKQLRSKIGMVPQHAVLFSGSVRENIQWGKKGATDEEIWNALEIAQAKAFVEKKKSGLDAMVAQGGKNLSGGQRQRLTIARALVRRPEIIILDDSSSALDYATDSRLQKAMKEKLQGITLLIVSQRVANIRHADRILVLDDGAVVGFDKHDRLIEKCAVYREICLSQDTEKENTGT